MGLKKRLLYLLLTIINKCLFWVRTDKMRITFISMTHATLQDDFLQIDTYFKTKKKFHLHYNLIVFKQNIWGQFKYMLNCCKQLYEIRRSRVVLLHDNNYVISNFKHPNCFVIQLWHACGAIKKFGNQIPREYKIQNYDAVVACATYWAPVYAKAFSISEEQVLISGMPRLDILQNSEIMQAKKADFYVRYPHLRGKYLILYAPTFRGNIIQGMYQDDLDGIQVVDALDADMFILYKLHPLLKDVQALKHPQIIDVFDEDLYTVLYVADCLISDYSSILFDYSTLNKKALCFAKDEHEYEINVGFNINYQTQMPTSIIHSEKDLAKALLERHHFDEKRMQAFRKTFTQQADGKNLERVITFMETLFD